MNKITIPEDIVEGINKIAKEKKIEKATLLADLKQILKDDAAVQKIKDTDVKVQVAWGILASKHVSGSGGASTEITIQPLTIADPRKPKDQYIADMYALTWLEGEKNPVFSKFNGWREIAENMSKMNLQKRYKVSAKITKSAKGISGTLADTTEITEIDDKIIDIKAVVDEMYNNPDIRCTIADANRNIANFGDDLNVRVIKGTIVRANPTRDGRSVSITIIDPTFTNTQHMSGFTVFGNIDQHKCDIGSKCYFTGCLAKRKDSDEVRMRNAIIVPLISIPLNGSGENE